MVCSSDRYLLLALFQIYSNILLQTCFKIVFPSPYTNIKFLKRVIKYRVATLLSSWRYGSSYPLGIIFNNLNQLQNKAQKMSALCMKGLLKKPS